MSDKGNGQHHGDRFVQVDRTHPSIPPVAMTAEELLLAAFPDPVWVLLGLLAEGVALLCGKPKIGKSWMALGIALAVAFGGKALSYFDAEQGDVLYLALEDNWRRLKRRLHQMMEGEGRMPPITFWNECPKASDGGLDHIRHWLTNHLDAKLVVIDTLEKFRDRRGGANLYEVDYAAVGALQDLAGEFGVVVLIIHHLKKGESDDPYEQISGSTGLLGAADTAVLLKRERGTHDAVLLACGRELENEVELAMQFDQQTATWAVLGNAEEYRRSQEQQRIIACIRGQAKTIKEISSDLGESYDNVRQMVYRMENDGKARRMGKSGREILYQAVPMCNAAPGNPRT